LPIFYGFVSSRPLICIKLQQACFFKPLPREFDTKNCWRWFQVCFILLAVQAHV
jgi:hypothetical protein